LFFEFGHAEAQRREGERVMVDRQRLEAIVTAVVDIAFRIHQKLGPGLLESVYVKILVYELKKQGFNVDVEVPVHVIWDGVDMGVGYRADIVIEGLLIIEVKSAEQNAPLHKKQLLTYLKLMQQSLGLLLNFNLELMKSGISRVANNLE
jgi:GxxExxY protein